MKVAVMLPTGDIEMFHSFRDDSRIPEIPADNFRLNDVGT